MADPLVLWWRMPAVLPRVGTAQTHTVGWTDAAGRPHGRISLLSHHRRLDAAAIETALLEQLAEHYPTPPGLCAAGSTAEPASLEATLRIAGHSVVDDDLHSRYGLDLIGHMTARLLGRGPEADVVVERTLGDHLRAALLRRAADDIDRFGSAGPTELLGAGWQRVGADDWRIVYAQA